MIRSIAAVSIALISSAASANPVVLARCLAPSGYVIYNESVPPGKRTDWQRDQITNGAFLLVKRSDERYDIVFTDATKRTASSIDDGGQIVVVNDQPGAKVFLVSYPDSIETWYFKVDSLGRGDVTYSQARYGDSINNKHTLMRASCSK
jgi:hypothetical protein